MSDRIRIKDIALRAGVSVGTVDRVIHNRANVSKKAVEKVREALEEMDYQPNMYASALAYNKKYLFILLIPKHDKEAYWDEVELFILLIPKHDKEAYWDEVELGVKECERIRRDFQIKADIVYYDRSDNESLVKTGEECLKKHPDGFVLVPSSLEATRKFTDHLHAESIPFVMLDSYMPSTAICPT